jgi:hypothetical protein
VTSTIQFHHQPCSVAVEVDNEAPDDLLSPEVEAIETVRTQMSPQPTFLNSQGAAQVLGCLELCARHALFPGDSVQPPTPFP